jgi:hypothetical protein
MDLPITGRCECGALSYACSAEPFFTVNCHCRACQKTSGAAFVSAFNVPISAVEVFGEMRRSTRVGDTGKEVVNGFCAVCGSRVFSFPSSLEGRMGIFAASLDDPGWFRPAVNIYASSAPAWLKLDDSLPSFDTVPTVIP